MSERNIVWLHTCYPLKHHQATVAWFGKKNMFVFHENEPHEYTTEA